MRCSAVFGVFGFCCVCVFDFDPAHSSALHTAVPHRLVQRAALSLDIFQPVAGKSTKYRIEGSIVRSSATSPRRGARFELPIAKIDFLNEPPLLRDGFTVPLLVLDAVRVLTQLNVVHLSSVK